jgi:hypothetical protein
MWAVAADVNADKRPDLIASYWTGRDPGFVAVWVAGTCAK